MSLYFMPSSSAFGQHVREYPGAKLYFYEQGTTTPKNTYTTDAETIAHTNPVIADGTGVFAPIYLTGNYKVVLKDKDDVTIWTADNVPNLLNNVDYKGDFDSSTNGSDYPVSGEKGHTYRVSTGFALNPASGSWILETGDFIMCNKNAATGIDADWDILRTANHLDTNGERTVLSLGTNQNLVLTPSGTGNVTAPKMVIGVDTVATGLAEIIGSIVAGQLKLTRESGSGGEWATAHGGGALLALKSRHPTLEATFTWVSVNNVTETEWGRFNAAGEFWVNENGIDLKKSGGSSIKFEGTSALTNDASGKITVSSVGTNQDLDLTPSGTGDTHATAGDIIADAGDINAAGSTKGYQLEGNTVLNADASGKTTLTSYGTNQDLDLNTTGTGVINAFKDIATAAGKGVDFSANTPLAGMTSQLFDDYEEGTWTPIATAITTPTYSTQEGQYVKIGSIIHATGRLVMTGGGVGAANMGIGGLPKVSGALRHQGSVTVNVLGALPANVANISSWIINGQDIIFLRLTYNDGTAASSMTTTQFTNLGDCEVTISYSII